MCSKSAKGSESRLKCQSSPLYQRLQNPGNLCTSHSITDAASIAIERKIDPTAIVPIVYILRKYVTA
jgi:hypothetical protein